MRMSSPSGDPRSSVSTKELMEEFDRILAEKGVKFDLVPFDWDIIEEFLRENFSPPPLRPPNAPSAPPQCYFFHLPAGGALSLGQIRPRLATVQLADNVVLQPLGFLKGEVLYAALPPPPPLPPPLNTCNSRKRTREEEQDDGRPYVKKPPNAFMLFLKEQRPKVAAELHVTNSAAVNSIVGERWKSLSEEQKAEYCDQARAERRLHEQQHPGWSCTDNYGEKRKRVRRRPTESGSTAWKTHS